MSLAVCSEYYSPSPAMDADVYHNVDRCEHSLCIYMGLDAQVLFTYLQECPLSSTSVVSGIPTATTFFPSLICGQSFMNNHRNFCSRRVILNPVYFGTIRSDSRIGTIRFLTFTGTHCIQWYSDLLLQLLHFRLSTRLRKRQLVIDNDNDVYFTLATSNSRIDKYKTVSLYNTIKFDVNYMQTMLNFIA